MLTVKWRIVKGYFRARSKFPDAIVFDDGYTGKVGIIGRMAYHLREVCERILRWDAERRPA